MVEKVRRVFVGKITNLFTRTPVDELVFIEFDQIEDKKVSKGDKGFKSRAMSAADKSSKK